MLIKIAVIYFTKTDVTGKLAKAIIAGATSQAGVSILEHRIDGKEIIEGRFQNKELFHELKQCSAIIFGTPTYMGGVSAQFKSFADATSELWCEQEWSDKVTAGFTSGSAYNGDQTGTLQYLATLASQHGMFWVGLSSAYGYKDRNINRLGCQLGVVAESSNGLVNEIDIKTAKYLGKRVAKLTLKINKT